MTTTGAKIKEVIAQAVIEINKEGSYGELSDYGKGKADGLNLAVIAAGEIIDVDKKANDIMIYLFGCLQDGPPFCRESIASILRAK